MKILDGKKLTEKILKELQERIKNTRLSLKLAVILVGENSVSQIFINQKEKVCRAVGIDFQLYKYPESIKTEELCREIKNISNNPAVHGLIVQLPLPSHIDSQAVINNISPEKDSDVLTDRNSGRFYSGNFSLLPPTLAGIVRLLEEYKIKLKGKNVVIVGAGKLVGRPAAFWSIFQDATVTVTNIFTKKLSDFTKKADIIISGAGKPGLIKGSMVKKGAVIIDAGTSKCNNKITGDVDFKTVSKKAGYITPVPGGVGPMTVAMLLNNLVKLNS